MVTLSWNKIMLNFFEYYVILINRKGATAHKVVNLLYLSLVINSPRTGQVHRWVYLFSLVDPIYVGKQCDKERTA